MKKYKIPIENIVTHTEVRNAFIAKYPKAGAQPKEDITQEEYVRFIAALKSEIAKQNKNAKK